jgi:hypothetical protein
VLYGAQIRCRFSLPSSEMPDPKPYRPRIGEQGVHTIGALFGLAARGTALPMQLDEISNAGLPGPIPSRRRVPPFGAGRNSYTPPLSVSATDSFKLSHF